MTTHANTTATTSAATTHLSRRRIIQGAAWAAPAIVLATGVPAAATSHVTGQCDAAAYGSTLALARGSWTVSPQMLRQNTLTNHNPETGWTPNVSGDDTTEHSGYALSNDDGFQSMDDNTLHSSASDPTSAWITVVAEYMFTATAKTSYTISFDSRVGYGNGNASQSARQSAVVSVNGEEFSKWTLGHYSSPLPEGNRTDAEMTAMGYELQGSWDGAKNRSFTFDHTGTDQAVITVRFTFTIEGIYPDGNSSNMRDVTDDIWVSRPTVKQGDCL
ncbi:hypothetical protein [Demequina salsinemoris]|uniref:hypothetical protein n=1 Tax=Demequina salsinemoris TaxID=577470 RepID=UPI0007816577|nr:hypothetical protein [Demequina salsinemoris]